MMIMLSKSVGDSFKKGGELPTAGIRPRNHRFKDAHAGTKPPLDVRTSNLDSGISGSGWDVIIVCNKFVR